MPTPDAHPALSGQNSCELNLKHGQNIHHQQQRHFKNKRKHLAPMYKAHFIKSHDNIFVRKQAIE
jgi:hypothetical protein